LLVALEATYWHGNIKQRRDKLRSTAHKIKEASVNIDNPVILACMQHQRSFREELQAHLDERQVPWHLQIFTCLIHFWGACAHV
jgi:hypothetical protein